MIYQEIKELVIMLLALGISWTIIGISVSAYLI
jgi:hypothetical protein